MRKILIVDDELDAVLLLDTFLRTKGYETVTALSGEEALAEIERELPALVLLDVMMPGKGGLEVLDEIRSRHPGLAVIMVTAISDPEVGTVSMETGAFDYVTKPIDLEHMERVVRWKMAMDRD